MKPVNTPKVRHNSKQEAHAEAERLAKLQPGDEFVVLSSEASVMIKSPFEWTQHVEPWNGFRETSHR